MTCFQSVTKITLDIPGSGKHVGPRITLPKQCLIVDHSPLLKPQLWPANLCGTSQLPQQREQTILVSILSTEQTVWLVV